MSVKNQKIQGVHIIEKYLKDNNLDGLTNTNYPSFEACCCIIDDIGCWCEGKDVLLCYPGKKYWINKDDPDSWLIDPDVAYK